MKVNNPLMAFKPHAKVYVKLPSRGYFYSDDVIEKADEYGVFALSAKEEMSLANPNLLMSGKAIEQVLTSCVADVNKANKLSIPDVEALLLGVKLATGEVSYNITAECPECSASGEFARDIEHLLDTCEFMEKEYPYDLENGLVLFLRPNSWESHSTLQQISFKQKKLIQAAYSEDVSDEERESVIRGSFKELIDMNMRLLADCVRYISTPQGEVDNPEHIYEYIGTLTKMQIREITTLIEKINNTGVSHSLDAKCNKCEHEWVINNLRYDPSHFFA